jgi:hypothetical protein
MADKKTIETATMSGIVTEIETETGNATRSEIETEMAETDATTTTTTTETDETNEAIVGTEIGGMNVTHETIEIAIDPATTVRTAEATTATGWVPWALGAGMEGSEEGGCTAMTCAMGLRDGEWEADMGEEGVDGGGIDRTMRRIGGWRWIVVGKR